VPTYTLYDGTKDGNYDGAVYTSGNAILGIDATHSVVMRFTDLPTLLTGAQQRAATTPSTITLHLPVWGHGLGTMPTIGIYLLDDPAPPLPSAASFTATRVPSLVTRQPQPVATFTYSGSGDIDLPLDMDVINRVWGRVGWTGALTFHHRP